MSYEGTRNDKFQGASRDSTNTGRARDEVFSKRVPAGKRTYFFDVKSTRSGEDYFVTITESKRVNESRYEKHKIFLYKEDFGKFLSAMHEVVDHIREERLPDYEFRGIPAVVKEEPVEQIVEGESIDFSDEVFSDDFLKDDEEE